MEHAQLIKKIHTSYIHTYIQVHTYIKVHTHTHTQWSLNFTLSALRDESKLIQSILKVGNM
jgi:hypothetical protein